MGENSECKSCKTWEEDMYWRHFSLMHFCLALPSDFHDHLKLPEKFAAHMKVKMPNKVSVKGPSGDVWDIDLLKTDDLLFVGDEWKAFVKANDLKENCFLVFKYQRNSNFEVLIFDQESSCERESAYFVRKFMHTDSKKRAMREESANADVMEEDDDGAVIGSAEKAKKPVLVASKRKGRPTRAAQESPDQPNVQSKNQTLREHITPENGQDVPEKEPSRNRRAKESRQDLEIPNDNGPSFQANDHLNKLEVQTEKRPKTNGTSKELNQMTPETRESIPVSDSARAGMVPNELNGHTSEKMVRPEYREISSDEDHSSKSRGKRGRGRGRGRGGAGSKLPTSPQKLVFNSEAVSDGRRFAKEYISERRPVTEVEKENTLQRAMENVTEHSFIAVMRPTAVYKRFFLSIPVDWVQKHLSSRSNEFVLRVGGRKWHTRLSRYYGNKSVGFSTGWKKFSLENSLEEFDVLLFKLIDQNNENGDVVMNVDIFRVVDNIVPLLSLVS